MLFEDEHQAIECKNETSSWGSLEKFSREICKQADNSNDKWMVKEKGNKYNTLELRKPKGYAILAYSTVHFVDLKCQNKT